MLSARNQRDSVLCDFRLQAESDARSTGIRPLTDYLPRFPGWEEDVAREYLSVLDALNPAPKPKDGEDAERYERLERIGSGGMGVVERVHDRQLDRQLAIKLLRRDGPRARARFQEEARITSLLDHPGVVPVHECGVDPEGRPFFTMRLVEGIDLEDVIARVHARDREWTMARALEALIKVCDTMAFAHSRGIVHRDLKPSNVRVGCFGEVYVMDWGLARKLSEDDMHEIRPRSADVEVVRGDAHEDGLPVVTLEGEVLGTPAYMPPEQARAELAAIGRHSDVYSVGAILHHLLTGRRPYADQVGASGSRDVLELVRNGPPTPVLELSPEAPRELAAISARAMQREPDRRYADMRGFADDLRAYLEGRVVSAHRSGGLARAQKWVARNRLLSVISSLVVVVAIVSLVLIGLQRLETHQRLVQLSGAQLKEDFDSLWPPHPAAVPVLERWIDDVRIYLSSRSENQDLLERMQKRALPMNPERPAERRAAADQLDFIRQRRALIEHFRDIDTRYEEGARGPEGTDLTWVRAQVANNSAMLPIDIAKPTPHLTFEFEEPDDQRLYDALRRVLAEQAEYEATAKQAGLLGLAEWGLAASRRVEDASLVAGAERWQAAVRSIADVRECPRYGGLEITPQLGLVPLGRNPDSALWEFWHVLSGDEPVRDDRGCVIADEQMGIVLVLVPGGTLRRGSQATDPAQPNYDPLAEANAPVRGGMELRPFFISKYEVTQGQWHRISGVNPSSFLAGNPGWSPLHPVERVTFAEARRVMRVAGLGLPTEAQWEYAARGGTDSPWSCGVDLCSVAGAGNVADRSYALSPQSQPSLYAEALHFEDGYAGTAPIGSYPPNPFGLCDTIGNVREWCADRGPFEYERSQSRIFTGERITLGDGTKAVRGGSFWQPPSWARSAARQQCAEGQSATDLGVRPSRSLQD